MRFIKEAWFKNWTIKLTSLFLALALWLAVRGDTSTESVTQVPLEIRNKPTNMEITNDHRTFVEVTVIWPARLSQPALTCVIDLQSREEGSHRIPLGPENVPIPPTSPLRVIDVRPSTITIVLERTATKEVPIEVPYEGRLASGYEIYSASHTPLRTLIRGPRSRVERLDTVKTEPILLEGRMESIDTLVNLILEDDRIRSSTGDTVRVRMNIGVQRILETIPDVKVTTNDPSITVAPLQVSLQVLVPPDFQGTLGAEDFRATLPSQSLDPSQTSQEIRPEIGFTKPLDSAIRIKGVLPSEVTVRRTNN